MLTAGPTWVPASFASALAAWAAAETACPIFFEGCELVDVVPDWVPDVVVLPEVPAAAEPELFPWASWTAELTAWPRLLNPASWAAAFPA